MSKRKLFTGLGALLLLGMILPQLAWAAPTPRVLVYMKGAKADMAQGAAEEVLINNGFKLIDRNQLQNIKEVDAALSSNDKDKLKALKHRYGIEVIVTGKAIWKFSNSRQIYGRTYNYYRPGVTMKAIVSDTAQIIYSKSLRGRETARSTAVEKMTKKVARLMADKIKSHWAKAARQQNSFEVVVSQLPYGLLKQLQNYLKNRPRVLSLARRNYAKKTAYLEVNYRGSRSQLESTLSQCSNPRLEIVRTTANRIEAKVKQGAAPPPDNTPPQVNIKTPGKNTYTRQTKIVVKGSVSDNRGVTKVTVQGTSVSFNNNTFAAQVSLQEGSNTIKVKAYDKAGNIGASSVKVHVDTQAPSIQIESPSSGAVFAKKTIVVEGIVRDPLLQSVKVQGELATVKQNRFRAKIKVKDGRITISAVARDSVGNVGRDSVTIKIDTKPPQVSFKVMIRGSVDKPGSRVWVNGKEVNVDSNGNWKTLIDIGKVKKIVIEAVDPHGNRSREVRRIGN